MCDRSNKRYLSTQLVVASASNKLRISSKKKVDEMARYKLAMQTKQTAPTLMTNLEKVANALCSVDRVLSRS